MIPTPGTAYANIGEAISKNIPVQASDFTMAAGNMVNVRALRAKIGGDYKENVNKFVRAGVDFVIHGGIALGASYAIREGMKNFKPSGNPVADYVFETAAVSLGQTLAAVVQQPVAAGARWVAQSLFGRQPGEVKIQKLADEINQSISNANSINTAPRSPSSR
jgi:hypothetical protein